MSGDLVAAVALDRMLDAVNRVRAAAGWATVTWANILGSNDPLPVPGNLVVLHHFTSCRSRMNEALQALGALGKVYTDSDLTRVELKAVHINEVLEAVR